MYFTRHNTLKIAVTSFSVPMGTPVKSDETSINQANCAISSRQVQFHISNWICTVVL